MDRYILFTLYSRAPERDTLSGAVNRSPYSQNCRELAFPETRLQDYGRSKRPKLTRIKR